MPSTWNRNLEPPQNASFDSQGDESLAFLLNHSGGSNDLVVGTAVDARPLYDPSPPSNDAFYVGRDSSNCAAAVDGGMPFIANFEAVSLVGPAMAADPAHDAFFFADIYFTKSPPRL